MARLRYRLRKDKILGENKINYVVYGINVYSGLKRIRVFKDITLNKKEMQKQIKLWNHYQIALEHLEAIVEDFVESEFFPDKEKTVLP